MSDDIMSTTLRDLREVFDCEGPVVFDEYLKRLWRECMDEAIEAALRLERMCADPVAPVPIVSGRVVH